MFYQLFGVSVLFEISESSAHRLTIREANRVLVSQTRILKGQILMSTITPNICPGIEKEGRFQRFLYEQLVVISLVAAIYPASLRISSSGHARNISPFCWSYLGYDPLQGKHKVLSIYQDIQTQQTLTMNRSGETREEDMFPNVVKDAAIAEA
ncbi:hypothetical protein YC2023_083366 [Brassica napus]